MQAVATSEADVKIMKRKGGTGARHDYIGSPGTINADPQAFLVVRPYAGARVDPHFHDVDQFQVVVAGDGRIGKKEIRPITFQYADAYTPYGPIVGRENGFSFFTLRNAASGGHWSMPGNKHNMPCRAGRNIAGTFDLGRPIGAGKIEREDLMESQDDGVDAVGFRLGSNAVSDGLPTENGGQYYLVCGGALIQNGKELPADSVIRVDRGEDVLQMSAGPDGAEVLCLQFGLPSDRPGSDPSLLAKRNPDAYQDRKPGAGA